MEEKKKMAGFTILKKDPMDNHKGLSKSVLSLDNVSPIIIDVEEKTASVELGAMHARSDVERGIKFTPIKEEVPNGKPYWLIWVTFERTEKGPSYVGVTACEMTVDRESKKGFKQLPDHVNKMDKSMKRHVILEHMDNSSKEVLATFLKNHNEEMWANANEELHKQLLQK